MKMVVQETTASDDASLSALVLQDASDDSAITLTPAFFTETASYIADITNNVDEITIKPTVNESGAAFKILMRASEDAETEHHDPAVFNSRGIGTHLEITPTDCAER